MNKILRIPAISRSDEPAVRRTGGGSVAPAAAATAGSYAVQAGLVVAGVGLLAASAWLSVPFYPVPLTMQTLAVLLLGGLLGARLGGAAVVSYLALGLAGAPVFHAGLAGPAVLAGPTGGYLLGFIPAALLMGWAVSRGNRRTGLSRLLLLALGAVLAEASIYAVGLPWLAGLYTGGDLAKAAAVGAVPYLLGDLLKAAVAIGAVRVAGRYRGRR
jgi:biotin transport system substrate-specific component